MPGFAGTQPFFTTRHGGVSQGAFGSLNLASHVPDQPAHILENRTRLMATLNRPLKTLCLVNQIHGTKTLIVGSEDHTEVDGDALVTDQPGVVIGVFTADCAPVLFCDPKARVIGAAHAGWRGAFGGILESCIQAMENLGAKKAGLSALIGPCISAESYTVGAEFREHFIHSSTLEGGMANEAFFRPITRTSFSDGSKIGKITFDLPGYIQDRLVRNGLSPDGIHHDNQCTFKLETDFFSHRRATVRRKSPCGRQMGGILLV
ncbi:MAG: peptidoglycan editing factor PgeF [Magnetococcales bacterium]|nr:peptidoglycan editing factor PgeF [Magnetococcales bacterium]